MKQEDLRAARLIEAKRRWIEDETPRREVEHLADLYETNWTPPASDDVLAYRAWRKLSATPNEIASIESGDWDCLLSADAYLAGCARGREGAKGLVEALERIATDPHARNISDDPPRSA